MHKCTPNLLTGQAVREVGKTLILSKQLNIRQIISCIDNIFITTPPQNSKWATTMKKINCAPAKTSITSESLVTKTVLPSLYSKSTVIVLTDTFRKNFK